MNACELLDAELALDRLDAELAAELPAHVRAFADAHVAGAPAPPAPAVARRVHSLEAAQRALPHPVLADRALAALRILAPLAIENDPGVAAARAVEPAWERYDELCHARDTATRARFDASYLDVIHRLHGSSEPPNVAWPEPIAGWTDPSEPITAAMVQHAWRDLAGRHGARGTCRIVHADVRPRAFVVEPGREVVVVVGRTTTPAARFAVLHELGHALAALVAGALPRVVDEAAAAYVARLLEHEGALDLAWYTPLAASSRAYRTQLAGALAAIERGAGERRSTRPPWALWHDAGAQAAYVDAEVLADRWWHELGALPDPGQLAATLVDARARIDRATTW